MPRGVDSRWDPARRPGHISETTRLVYRMANEPAVYLREGYDNAQRAARQYELAEIESMMSEHPTGMPTPKIKMRDKGLHSGSNEARVKGDTKYSVDPSIKKQ